jgi:hypothetical protein
MMIGRSTRRKKNIWGVRPGARDMRKEWINAFVKRLALIDLASTNIKDETAREEICKTIKGYRSLVPDLRDKAVWPDDKLPFIVKTSIRSLELAVAAIKFGSDSDAYRRVCARIGGEIKEEESDKKSQEKCRNRNLDFSEYTCGRQRWRS